MKKKEQRKEEEEEDTALLLILEAKQNHGSDADWRVYIFQF